MVEAEAESVDLPDICTTAEPETEPVALRVQEPRCVSALTSGIVERGNSLIAPKPSITLPYFNFNLDMDLKRINLNKLHSFLTDLDEKNQKNLFKINNKINGQINLSVNDIYSKYTLKEMKL